MRKPTSQDVPDRLLRFVRRVREAGGRAYLVGGAVRDLLLGLEPVDFDVEVHGLPLGRVEALLSEFGPTRRVGRSFGVLQVEGSGFDVSLPRRDRKVGAGHRGFEVDIDPDLGLEAALRRRDLTINAIAFDPIEQRVLDPLGGERDLERGVLRAADPRHFAEDPLRGLRVAQLAARFCARPDEELTALMRALDLSELPPERLFGEWRKLLLLGRRPSLGLEALEAGGLLHFFPELDRMRGVVQDPRWHPEGDVWTHTLLCLDRAAEERSGPQEEDEIVAFAVLLHDVGKPDTTEVLPDRVRSHGHAVVGVDLAREMLERMRAPSRLVKAVAALVRWHLEPVVLVQQGAGDRAFRRLARRLAEGGVNAHLLARLARADLLGRTTEAAKRGETPEVEEFLARARAVGVEREARADAVRGRDLIRRGLEPGPHFRNLLERCREVQERTGWSDPDRILDEVLGEG